MSRNRFELYGESLLELGVLVLIFLPLDTVLQKDYRFWLPALIGGAVLLLVGVEVERSK